MLNVQSNALKADDIISATDIEDTQANVEANVECNETASPNTLLTCFDTLRIINALRTKIKTECTQCIKQLQNNNTTEVNLRKKILKAYKTLNINIKYYLNNNKILSNALSLVRFSFIVCLKRNL